MKTEIIMVASGKGGVGKTTFTANLGSILADKGYKTCIIDLDLTPGKMDLVLGLESKVQFDISHILLDKKSTISSLIKDKRTENLFLLPAPRSNESLILSIEKLTKVIEDLKMNKFNFILIDCQSGLDENNPVRIATGLSNRSIVVTNPEKPSLRDADSIIALLENNQNNKDTKVHLVINKYIEPKLLSKKNVLKSTEIQRILAIPLLGTVSYELKNTQAVNEGTPIVYKNSKARNEYKLISEELIKIIAPESNIKIKKKKKISNLF